MRGEVRHTGEYHRASGTVEGMLLKRSLPVTDSISRIERLPGYRTRTDRQVTQPSSFSNSLMSTVVT